MLCNQLSKLSLFFFCAMNEGHANCIVLDILHDCIYLIGKDYDILNSLMQILTFFKSEIQIVNLLTVVQNSKKHYLHICPAAYEIPKSYQIGSLWHKIDLILTIQF